MLKRQKCNTSTHTSYVHTCRMYTHVVCTHTSYVHTCHMYTHVLTYVHASTNVCEFQFTNIKLNHLPTQHKNVSRDNKK